MVRGTSSSTISGTSYGWSSSRKRKSAPTRFGTVLNTTSASGSERISPFHQYRESTATTLPQAARCRESAPATAVRARSAFGYVVTTRRMGPRAHSGSAG
ncbi:MAG: hypothetical protein WBF81_00235 [Thermoplasmata archaeon]